MKLNRLTSAAIAALFAASASASTVSLSDPQPGGIGYRYTLTMGGLDTATFSNHVGAWSWEDNSLFNEANGEPPVGWTHTSNWVALNVTARSVLKIRIERDATVPWPSQQDPNRLASVSSMFPSFTIWQNWDNDFAPQAFVDANNNGTPVDDWHTYNNRGAVAWAEDLVYKDHYNNSTLEAVERTYVLEPGQYSIVVGSNAPATDTNRQGYKVSLTTTQDLPVVVTNDSYFTASAVDPLEIPAAKGVLANDTGVAAPDDVLEVTSQPKLGTVAVSADGAFIYTPGQYFGVEGYDSFTYRLLVDGDPGTPTTTGSVVISTFASAAGCHAGLIRNEDSLATAGIVKFDLTSTGSWTSAVQHLGKRYAFIGKLGVDGTLTRRGQSPLDIEFHLSIHADGDRHVHAHIHGGADHFSARVNKSPFSVANPTPSLGRHLLTLEVASTTAATPPSGGSGLLRVKANGSATLSGALGDGTSFTCSSALLVGTGPGPVLTVYAGIYRAPGSISGELNFGAAASSNATGILTAVSPGGKTAKPGFSVTYDVKTARR